MSLVQFAKRPKAKKTKNLISGDVSARDKEIMAEQAALNITAEQEDEIIPLWKSELYLDAVEEAQPYHSHQIPVPILQHMNLSLIHI